MSCFNSRTLRRITSAGAHRASIALTFLFIMVSSSSIISLYYHAFLIIILFLSIYKAFAIAILSFYNHTNYFIYKAFYSLRRGAFVIVSGGVIFKKGYFNDYRTPGFCTIFPYLCIYHPAHIYLNLTCIYKHMQTSVLIQYHTTLEKRVAYHKAAALLGTTVSAIIRSALDDALTQAADKETKDAEKAIKI